MMRLLLTLAIVMAPKAMALSIEAAESIHTFQECAPNAKLSCAKSGTCLPDALKSQFCSACVAVEKAPSRSCHSKTKGFTAAEALFGYLQGSCAEVCGASGPGAVVTSQGHKAGDKVMVFQTHKGKRAFGAFASESGGVLSDLYLGGEKKLIGDVVVAGDDAVAPEVAGAFACVKSSSDPFLESCMENAAKCNAKRLAKTGKCGICNAVSGCKDGARFAEEFFEISCRGC